MVFKRKVTLEPLNAVANFSYGRVLLATKRSRQASPYLEKTTALETENAGYLLWLIFGQRVQHLLEFTNVVGFGNGTAEAKLFEIGQDRVV